MAKIIGLPKLSPTMDEGTLVRWTKAEGESVEVDDLLAEVETDKATMEFRSFDKGVLLKILVPEGETLAPDTPVAVIGNQGEDISSLLAGGAASAKPAAPATSAQPAAPASNGANSNGASVAAPASAGAASGDGRTLASPLVRKMAREHGIALEGVPGTGPGGRIIKRDIQSSIGQGPASAAATTTVAASAEVPGRPASRVEKLSSMRKTIARRLTESKQTIPHFYLTVDVDAEPLTKLRQKINKEMVPEGEKVSVNDLIIKACAVGLRRVPEVNASFMGDSIHYHQRVDVSVAVAIPDGLVTPVVRDADRLGALEISRQVKALAKKARDKKLTPEEMMNGTFSVSNLGMFGIEDFGAVINPPEGAILAVGTTREEPVVKDGAVVPGKRMRMTLSCDHRVVDGAVGAKFLKELKTLLEQPLHMIV